MKELFEALYAAFVGEELREVYPGFDAVDLPRKSDRLFTVFAMQSLQLERPFPDGKAGVHPFRAVIRVSVLTPMTEPASKGGDYFSEVVMPRMKEIGGRICELRPAQVDAKLGRVVTSGDFTVTGLYLYDEEEETA